MYHTDTQIQDTKPSPAIVIEVHALSTYSCRDGYIPVSVLMKIGKPSQIIIIICKVELSLML